MMLTVWIRKKRLILSNIHMCTCMGYTCMHVCDDCRLTGIELMSVIYSECISPSSMTAAEQKTKSYYEPCCPPCLLCQRPLFRQNIAPCMRSHISVCSVTTFTFTCPSTFIDETSPILGITGCPQSSGSVELFLPFVLLFALEFGQSPRSFMYTQSSDQNLQGLLSLTFIRAIQSWGTTVCLLFYYAMRSA
ncbi:hypothetical protein CY34DRAFT_573176 [Suillus luteus UH-Slu-Lm8-n1]|uniref:Uncharacterized protein n=1 Tax=Suillus luteus UH-Slu-Lm8-n1 TaxID=930992 RepID=A0A0D0BPG4_9AGAM|nr:hypothetical protein CY34DRAFT_573176 [Suillus luteus UH-Slu-Lm8-n1]